MTVCKYTIPLLSDLFFVKQLETAHKCLTKCRNHALALSGNYYIFLVRIM